MRVVIKRNAQPVGEFTEPARRGRHRTRRVATAKTPSPNRSSLSPIDVLHRLTALDAKPASLSRHRGADCPLADDLADRRVPMHVVQAQLGPPWATANHSRHASMASSLFGAGLCSLLVAMICAPVSRAFPAPLTGLSVPPPGTISSRRTRRTGAAPCDFAAVEAQRSPTDSMMTESGASRESADHMRASAVRWRGLSGEGSRGGSLRFRLDRS
jgi:hypothetical protein